MKIRYLILSLLLIAGNNVVFSWNLSSGTKGGIKGKVLDQEQKPVEGAKITITNLEYTTSQFIVKSNDNGEFIQIGLEPGYYQVVVEKEGFDPVMKQIRVHIKEIVEKEFILDKVKEVKMKKETPGEKEAKKAQKFYEEGNFKDAIESYQQALQKNPDNPEYHYNLGIVYIELGDVENAITALQKAIEIQPQNFLALKALGQIFVKEKKDYAKAVEYYSRASDISPDDPEVFFNLGVGHLNLQNFTQALEAFQKTIDCNESFSEAYYQLGLLHINQNNFEKAMEALEKFIELAPDDPKVPTADNMLEFLRKQKKNQI